MSEEPKVSSEAKTKVETDLQEMLVAAAAEETIKTNEIEFEYDNQHYRIKKPTNRIRLKLNERRLEKYHELLKDSRYKFEDDLKKIYNEKGLNIDDLTREFNSLELRKKTIQQKIGDMLKTTAVSNPDLSSFSSEIEEIVRKEYEISVKKNSLLEFSIENQLTLFTYSYLTFLVTEKQEGESWKPVWTSYEEYLDTEEGLINRAVFYMTLSFREGNE